jgi:hypothetical protein
MPEPKRPLKVFLCHASTDKPKVRELYRYLKKRGIQPWFDEEDLVGGQDWQVEIPKALATSDAIIICLTKNSVDKEGYIQKEIKFALDKALEMPEGRIFLIPVKFEECEVPFSLSRYQWVDLTVESGYAKMMKALKFRASQLERSMVEVSKKDVEEENLAREKKEREDVERERKEKELREKYALEASEKTKRGTEESISKKKESKPVVVSSRTKKHIPYWFSGFVILFLGILLCANFGSQPMHSVPRPTLPTTEIMDAKGVSMALVPAGNFMMGSENGKPDEAPVHQVYLDSFYIDKYEVTNALYRLCVDDFVCVSPTNKDRYGDSQFDDYPFANASWIMAQSYCEWRNASLPSEAQWEKAARGIDQRSYPWGD